MAAAGYTHGYYVACCTLPNHRTNYPADTQLTREQGKAKRKAWQELVDQNISADEAQKKYVTLVEDLKTKYGFDETKKPETVGTA